jgi:hypothetical protein
MITFKGIYLPVRNIQYLIAQNRNFGGNSEKAPVCFGFGI